MAPTWERVIKHYRDSDAYILGCSASPARLDGKGLRGNFDHMVMGPSPRYLMEQGRLAKFRLFVPRQIDTSGLHTARGDYIESEAEELVNKPAITGDSIAEWRKHANRFRTVAYCQSIAHSKAVACAFREAGIPALHIDGETSDEIRIPAFRDLADGKIEIITNMALLTEGVDISALAGKWAPIKCVINLRLTQSLPLWEQICGRMSRPDGELSVMLDLTGTSLQLGMPDEDREWTLDGIVKPDKKKATSIKVCPKCWCAVKTGTPVCPECGMPFPKKDRKVEERDGELEEVTPEERAKRAEKRRFGFEQSQANTVEALVKIWRAKGYKGNLEGRATHVLAARAAKAGRTPR
jgi:superfamily II DNA or RNA helicase